MVHLLPVVQNEIGKGSFQELDQISAVTMYTKWRGAPNTVAAIPESLQSALQVSTAPFLGCYHSLQRSGAMHMPFHGLEMLPSPVTNSCLNVHATRSQNRCAFSAE